MQFLRITQGSLKELETQLIIAHRTGIAQGDATEPLISASSSVGELLRLLIRRLSGE